MNKINCQISSGCIVDLCAGIPVPRDPFLIVQNNWPSGRSLITSAQVKFLGGGSSLLAKLPLPLPLAPWHSLQAVGLASWL